MAHVFESIADQPVAWGESDIDEMLAEYLLDDVAEEAGATLPYNDHGEVRKRSRVSPEHNEDGNMPPVPVLHNSVSSGPTPDASVPDPLSRSLPQGFQIIQKPLAANKPKNTSLSSSEFLIDEKELADAVSKAMEVPVFAPVPISPVEKKTTKRRRMDAAPKSAIQPATSQKFPTGEGKLALFVESVKSSRRKDCPEEHERRRERNRVLARKSRQKKKCLFETLQKEVARLNHHNQIMREIITTKMGITDLDTILNQYAPQADDDSVDHGMEAASVSGSDSD
ncbi:hypothetical protein FisN_17Lh029 [Fistulifera solaris]|uniref:BZIP domain-containing protein n=1 Tax=Fistulifera solaris TaxID=1519565 RepID=A0A1Z5J669_FISSO|nr:hypothetical protein FisN_17Lh029 [Fistulifera solaris]|eukprot:GAX09281.1 hypothetical protein FisN_17Lh029 [Fistulifera solaris]